jgi:hypothetical protein
MNLPLLLRSRTGLQSSGLLYCLLSGSSHLLSPLFHPRPLCRNSWQRLEVCSSASTSVHGIRTSRPLHLAALPHQNGANGNEDPAASFQAWDQRAPTCSSVRRLLAVRRSRLHFGGREGKRRSFPRDCQVKSNCHSANLRAPLRQQGVHGGTTGQGHPHQGRVDRGGQEAVGGSEETPYSAT